MSEIITDKMAIAALTALFGDPSWMHDADPAQHIADMRRALSVVAPDIYAVATAECSRLGWLTPAKVAEIEAGEREACARIADDRERNWLSSADEIKDGPVREARLAFAHGANQTAKLIRARRGHAGDAPDFDALSGAAPGATGADSSEDFVRKMRDEWDTE